MITPDILMLCAPNVETALVEQIIAVESSGNLLALNVNGAKLDRKPSSAADAAEIAREYISKGHTVDLGLMQVNSTNLKSLGYRIEDMFEPCKNIAAGAKIFSQFFRSAKARFGDEAQAVLAALSAYNTGDFNRGFTNGYVDRYSAYLTASMPDKLLKLEPHASALAAQGHQNPFQADTAVFVRRSEQSAADSPPSPVHKAEPEARPDPVTPAGVDPHSTAIVIAGKAIDPK